jgi:hypothetical protein
MSTVHVDIDHIKAWVREDVLYNMDKKYETTYVQCRIIAFSSYPGHAPTFHILLDNSSLFYYVPPHLLHTIDPRKYDYAALGLTDLVYHNCPDHEFSLSKLDYLTNTPDLSVYLKRSNIWACGTYLWTVDWYRGNDVLHAIVLGNGQISFMPNHKISLDKKELPQYKKLKYEWKV